MKKAIGLSAMRSIAIVLIAVIGLTACSGKKESGSVSGSAVSASPEIGNDIGAEYIYPYPGNVPPVPIDFGAIDLTEIFRKDLDFLGTYDVQKMGMVFLSTTKKNTVEYEVMGKSKLDKNICDFKGTMTVEYAEEGIEYSELLGENHVGNITGKYRFEENKNQSNTGVFEGTFEIVWDNDYIGNASFHTFLGSRNSSPITVRFLGTWTSYSSRTKVQATFGNHPSSLTGAKFFRSGGGDSPWFFPDEELRSKGWGFEIDLLDADDEERAKIQDELEKEWGNWWK